MKYSFIDQQRKAYPIKLLCSVLNVSRSGYYLHLKQLKPIKRSKDIYLLIKLKELAKKTRHSYGSRRISKFFKSQGFSVGRYKSRTLMKQAKIECKQRRSYKITTKSDPHLPIVANKLNRQFRVESANKAWVADITYLSTQEGWVYLAAVLDLYSRKVVGWSLSNILHKQLVCDALAMALGRRQPQSGLLHHSDRGSQYASHDYQKQLNAVGITVSMSRKGNCWDNAVMERFFGSLKSERIQNKKYQTREQAKADVIDYIEMFYNAERLHSTLGYLAPNQFENRHLSL